MARKREEQDKNQQEKAERRSEGSRKSASKRKPASKKAASRKSSRSNNVVIRYFQDTATELRKVTWPNQEQIMRLTLIVLGTAVVFTLFLGLLDVGFQRIIGFLV